MLELLFRHSVFQSKTNYSFQAKLYKHKTRKAATMESMKVDCNTSHTSIYEKTIIKVKFPDQVDLRSHLYFALNIPRIFSKNGMKFRWIHNLGHVIIDNYSISIAGGMIYKYYRDEVGVESVPIEFQDPDTFENCISSRTIYLPLEFWFHRDIYKSCPVQCSDVELSIELRPWIDLYELYYDNEVHIPTNDRSEHKLKNFISDAHLVSDTMIDARCHLIIAPVKI